jgi:WhiB family redox-sensing transcriptional regulator
MTTQTAQPRLFNSWVPLWMPHTQTPCAGVDPEVFFADDPELIDTAKAICGGCLAREECLEHALMRNEPHGVWGGELFESGTVIARKRPRGRPRKQPPPLPAPIPIPIRVQDTATSCDSAARAA